METEEIVTGEKELDEEIQNILKNRTEKPTSNDVGKQGEVVSFSKVEFISRYNNQKVQKLKIIVKMNDNRKLLFYWTLNQCADFYKRYKVAPYKVGLQVKLIEREIFGKTKVFFIPVGNEGR